MNKYLWRLLCVGQETELSVAYLVRDLEKQKEIEALSFCSPHFSFYSVSAVVQRGEGGQSRFQEKVSVVYFHLWPFRSSLNGRGVLPEAAAVAAGTVPWQNCPRRTNKARLLVSHHIPTHSSKGEGALLANLECTKGAKHPMPPHLCSFPALTWGCCPLSWFLSCCSKERAQPSY